MLSLLLACALGASAAPRPGRAAAAWPAYRLAAPAPLPARASLAPAAAAPAPAAPPSQWDFGGWTPPPRAAADAWRFADPLFGSSRLWDGAREAERLGAGAMGVVFAHPSDPAAVVKVARVGYAEAAGQFFAPDDAVVLDYEDYDLDRLAALGAAPRPLARLTVSARPASVRERIHGETVAGLKRRGLYGKREKALAYALLGRIAEGGFVARDLNLGNIMIGRRAGEEEDCAWVVDTLGVHPRPEVDAARRREEMLSEPVPWLSFRGFGLARPLRRMLGLSD